MKRLSQPLLLISVWLVGSCATTPVTKCDFGNLSPAAAREEAIRDIASGRMKVYLAGTRATCEAGVDQNNFRLIKDLPRSKELPIGCTDPLASKAVEYAAAYNRVIVRFLKRAHQD